MAEALLQVYLSKEKDIRKCPNPSCKYAGIINTKSACISPYNVTFMAPNGGINNIILNWRKSLISFRIDLIRRIFLKFGSNKKQRSALLARLTLKGMEAATV